MTNRKVLNNGYFPRGFGKILPETFVVCPFWSRRCQQNFHFINIFNCFQARTLDFFLKCLIFAGIINNILFKTLEK